MKSITRVTWTTDSLEVNDYIKTPGYIGKVIGSVQRTFLDQETDQLVERTNKIIILFDPNKRKFSKMTFSSVVYEPATPEQIAEFNEEFELMLRTTTEENGGNKLWGTLY
ncbi:hypothetical protein [Enterococcus sp. 5H]|uniref:hypothetical protein n=1 Tax=Enterococcus sp. 5H TaxID=1229490 RepID=UPI002303B094|nr:hypothetical protein [Enterococcus sp. 5H]MDA9470780.1 hypothetical protein [Enterococcus sp. 5H]